MIALIFLLEVISPNVRNKMSVTEQLGFQPVSSSLAIALPKDAIMEWCDRWRVREFYLFGSVLRADFHSQSDIDVMVQFFSDVRWGFEWVEIKQELATIFDRDVDLLTKNSVESSPNWVRRQEILATAQLVYVKG